MAADIEGVLNLVPVTPPPRYKSKLKKVFAKNKAIESTIKTMEQNYKMLVNDYDIMNTKNVNQLISYERYFIVKDAYR